MYINVDRRETKVKELRKDICKFNSICNFFINKINRLAGICQLICLFSCPDNKYIVISLYSLFICISLFIMIATGSLGFGILENKNNCYCTTHILNLTFCIFKESQDEVISDIVANSPQLAMATGGLQRKSISFLCGDSISFISR